MAALVGTGNFLGGVLIALFYFATVAVCGLERVAVLAISAGLRRDTLGDVLVLPERSDFHFPEI